jgi:RNA polymerase sigma factor for flagellar operon FliA
MSAAVTQRGSSSGAEIDHLVRSHLPLVGHLVREVLGRVPAHVNRDDLISAGMLALVTSAQGYDASRGVPFGRFAAIRIRGGLTDELRTMDWASRAVRGKAREIETVRNGLAATLGRAPGRAEIAQTMGVGVAELDAVDADVQRAAVLSIQGLTEDNGADLLPDADAGPEGLLMRREQLGILRDAIAELPDRLRTVVEEYFFQQRKMTDIAADLGVTESRVSQLRSEALVLLRDGMRAQDSDAPPSGPATSRRRSHARDAYHAAIAARSSLADRLRATTILGEAHSMVTARSQVAN